MTTQGKTCISNRILKGPEVYWPEKNGHVGKMMLDVFKEKHNYIAMIDSATGESVTYGELAAESIRCALWLKEENISGGDVILMYSLNSIPLFVSFFATLYVGGIVSVCSPQQPPENLRHHLSVVRPKIVLSIWEEADKVLATLKEENLEDTKVIVFGKLAGFRSFNEILDKKASEEVTNFKCSNVDSHASAIILMTSGSTGMPKSVEHSYEGLKYLIGSATLEISEIRNVLTSWITPLSGIRGMLKTFSFFFTDSTILIMNPQNTGEMCAIIEKYQVQDMFLTGSAVQKLVLFEALAMYNLSSMLNLMIAGSRTRVEVLDAIKNILPDCAITMKYGSTEIGGTVLQDVRYIKSRYMGTVASNTQLKVVDLKTGDSLEPQKSGEICVKKPFMMKGYYNNSSATEKILDSEGWIHTGDLGYYDEEGNVYLLDRIKMMIHYRNHILLPSEMENALAKHPEVKDLVVIGVPHPMDGEHAIAFVVKAKQSEVTENDLIRFSSCLGEQKMIRGVVFVEEIPYTPSSKINRIELLKAFNKNNNENLKAL